MCRLLRTENIIGIMHHRLQSQCQCHKDQRLEHFETNRLTLSNTLTDRKMEDKIVMRLNIVFIIIAAISLLFFKIFLPQFGTEIAQKLYERFIEQLSLLSGCSSGFIKRLAARLNCEANEGDFYHQKRLIGLGADPNKTDYDRRSPLVSLATRIIPRKLVLHFDLKPIDKFGITPLFDAIKWSCSILVNAGASLTSDDAGDFLCMTVARRKLNLLKRVLVNGINPNTTSCSCFRRAVFHGKVTCRSRS